MWSYQNIHTLLVGEVTDTSTWKIVLTADPLLGEYPFPKCVFASKDKDVIINHVGNL